MPLTSSHSLSAKQAPGVSFCEHLRLQTLEPEFHSQIVVAEQSTTFETWLQAMVQTLRNGSKEQRGSALHLVASDWYLYRHVSEQEPPVTFQTHWFGSALHWLGVVREAQDALHVLVTPSHMQRDWAWQEVWEKYPCVQVGMQEEDQMQFTSPAHAVGFKSVVHFSPQVAALAFHAQPAVAWQLVWLVAVVPQEFWHEAVALS